MSSEDTGRKPEKPPVRADGWNLSDHPDGERVCGPPPETWEDARPKQRPAQCCATCDLATADGRYSTYRCHHRLFPTEVPAWDVCDAFFPQRWVMEQWMKPECGEEA